MSPRKLPPTYVEKPFVEGYLHDRVTRHKPPEYGYAQNHLPEVSDKPREIETSYKIAMARRVSE